MDPISTSSHDDQKAHVRFTFGHLLVATTALCVLFATALVSATLANFLVSVCVGALCGHVMAGFRGLVPGIAAALFWSSVFSIAPIGIELFWTGPNFFSEATKLSLENIGEDDALFVLWFILNVTTSILGGYIGGRVAMH